MLLTSTSRSDEDCRWKGWAEGPKRFLNVSAVTGKTTKTTTVSEMNVAAEQILWII